MTSAQPDDRMDDAALAGAEYAKALGARLRAVRTEQHLSLHGVERKSGGRWKAVVVGSYERGDRAVSVQKLAELAEFYGVSTSDLLPNETVQQPVASGVPLSRIVLNLDRVEYLNQPGADVLRRFVASIQRQRGPAAATSLPIRLEDLNTLALLYDVSTDELTSRLVRWQVLSADSLII